MISVFLLFNIGSKSRKMKEPLRAYCLLVLVMQRVTSLSSFPSEDTETVSNSSEGKCGSPHDLLETIFIRKVGAFVNKPINQVTSRQLSHNHMLPLLPVHTKRKQSTLMPGQSRRLRVHISACSICLRFCQRHTFHKILLGCDSC